MARVVACPTPVQYCTGGKAPVNAFLRGAPPRIHQTHSQAYNCYRRYLVDILGYEDRGNREFSPPGGGPVIFLTKKSRFGTAMRYGKLQERWMPREKGRSGMIIST